MKKPEQNNERQESQDRGSLYHLNSEPQANFASFVINHLTLEGNERILDIGCRDGKTSAQIASRLANGLVTGIDTFPDMIASAQTLYPPEHYFNLDFKVHDASLLSFNQQFGHDFDVVLSFFYLSWLQNQQTVLSNMVKSLKNHGTLITFASATTNNILVQAAQELLSSTWQHASISCYPLDPQATLACVEQMNLENINISIIDYPILFPNTQAFEQWLRAIPITSNLSEEMTQKFIQELVCQFVSYTQNNNNGSITYNLPILALSAIKKNS